VCIHIWIRQLDIYACQGVLTYIDAWSSSIEVRGEGSTLIKLLEAALLERILTDGHLFVVPEVWVALLFTALM
jgi:hypothetical protein